jgi:cell division protein FtsX
MFLNAHSINSAVPTILAQSTANDNTLMVVAVAVCLAGLFTMWFVYSRIVATRSDQREVVNAGLYHSAAAQSELDPRLIAILAAAATAAVGRRVQIRRITFINRDTVSGWAEAGRTSIQMSHNLRRTI